MPPWYVEVGKFVDLTCFTNETDVDALRKYGVNTEFWNIGYDPMIFTPNGKVQPGTPEIVFMGNNYGCFPLSKERLDMAYGLRKRYGKRFGLYGFGWPEELKAINIFDDQPQQATVYRSCRIAINQNHFDHKRFSSDRIFRLMGAGAFCACRYFPGIEKDYTEGRDLISWKTFDELYKYVDYYLDHEPQRAAIARLGHELVRNRDTLWHRYQHLRALVEPMLLKKGL